MSSHIYKLNYPQPNIQTTPNMRKPISQDTKLSQMSINYASQIDRYSRPDIPSRNQIKYKYDDLNNLASVSNMNFGSSHDRGDYPTSGRHSRFPVLINCDGCNQLTMTDTQYQHGCASKTWCFLLLPFFCTGLCCLCLNSCKDVKHICSKCRKQAGICKSKCI